MLNGKPAGPYIEMSLVETIGGSLDNQTTVYTWQE